MKIKLKIFLIYFAFLITVISVFALFNFYDLIKINTQNNRFIFFILLSVGIILPLIITLLISYNISGNIKQLRNSLKNFFLNKKIPDKLITASEKKDELGEVYKELSELIAKYIAYGEFAEKLKQNDLNGELSVNKNERLGLSLLDIKENIITNIKTHKLNKLELERNNWYQSGVTEFTVLLQQYFKSSEEMAYPVIKKLANHLNIEQAGIFVLKKKNEKELLILEAAYAYDKKKQLDTELEPGESLVGKCAKEKKLIHIDDLPEGYTYIGSGLGEDTPKSLILAPLIYEKKLYGVIEIASLKRIPDYKIKFLQVISERIAAELSNINTKILTAKLAEDSKKQSEELALKERKSEQKISDLTKEKEILITKNQKITEDFNRLNDFIPTIIFDTEGTIIDINKAGEQLYGINKEKAIKKRAFDILINNDSLSDIFQKVLTGDVIIHKLLRNNDTEELLEKYIPIKDKKNQTEKILLTSFLISS